MYDLIVIGGGPAGYVAAERAGHAGLTVLLAEKSSMGGVCLNEGCIPSKALLYTAKISNYARHGKAFGVSVADVSLDHAAAVSRKDNVVKTLVRGIEMKMKANNVEVIKAAADILPKDGNMYQVQISGQVYQSKYLLICSGSEPVLPSIPGLREGLESGFAITNREALSLQDLPQKLIVIGGGVIGLEMAYYYSSAGSTVQVLEMLDHIAGNMDIDISNILKNDLQKKGIEFNLSSCVTEIKGNTVLFESPDGVHALEADKALVCIGRRPSCAGFGLEVLAPEMDCGAVKTDEYMRTSVPGLYAAGDVNGRSMLAHTASREAEVAVNHILGVVDKMRYDFVPEVIYTNPEVALVGMTEADAVQRGLDAQVIRLPMGYSGRYLAEGGAPAGICKLVVERVTGRVLGLSLITAYASEIIYGMCLALEHGLTVEEIKCVIFPHPTVSEIIRESLFGFHS